MTASSFPTRTANRFGYVAATLTAVITFEVVAISINWLALIVSGILLSILFRR